ncbi:MAG: GIY-YIG nuclease family protein, partial [Candidatus Acidiferrales bacterium]
FYTGHSIDVVRRNKEHRKGKGLLGRTLQQFSTPLLPIVLREFNTRREAVEYEIYRMFVDHTWCTYGGLNFNVGDLPGDREGLYRANSERMKAMNADPTFAKEHSERMKTMHADPTFAKENSERCRRLAKAMHADPTFAKEHSERMKAKNHIRWHINRGIYKPETCSLCALSNT